MEELGPEYDAELDKRISKILDELDELGGISDADSVEINTDYLVKRKLRDHQYKKILKILQIHFYPDWSKKVSLKTRIRYSNKLNLPRSTLNDMSRTFRRYVIDQGNPELKELENALSKGVSLYISLVDEQESEQIF